MPSIDLWAGGSAPLGTWLDDVSRTYDVQRIITDKSTSITLIRNGSAQTAQTVRIEQLGRATNQTSEAGETGMYHAMVIGYLNHPTVTDTDIQRGDRFIYESMMYEVEMLMPGENNSIQAYAKLRG